MKDRMNLYDDLVRMDAPSKRARLIADLDQAYNAARPPAHLRSSVMAAWERHGQGRSQAATRGRRPRLAWVASVAATLVLALGGVTAYGRLQQPTMASAQTILSHAAKTTPHLVAGQILHVRMSYHNANTVTDETTHTTTPSQTSDGTTDLWMAAGADGSLDRLDSTSTSSDGSLLSRVVEVGTTRTEYNAPSNFATVTTDIPPTAPLRRMARNSPDLGLLVQRSQQASAQNVHLLPQQQLAGNTVDVVAVDSVLSAGSHSTVTFFIDAATYTLRGIDSNVVDAQGTLLSSNSGRVLDYSVAPLTAAPSTAFSFAPPAGTTVTTSVYSGPH